MEQSSIFDVGVTVSYLSLSGWPSGLRRQTQAAASQLGRSGLRMEAWVRIPLLTDSLLLLARCVQQNSPFGLQTSYPTTFFSGGTLANPLFFRSSFHTPLPITALNPGGTGPMLTKFLVLLEHTLQSTKVIQLSLWQMKIPN